MSKRALSVRATNGLLGALREHGCTNRGYGDLLLLAHSVVDYIVPVAIQKDLSLKDVLVKSKNLGDVSAREILSLLDSYGLSYPKSSKKHPWERTLDQKLQNDYDICVLLDDLRRKLVTMNTSVSRRLVTHLDRFDLSEDNQ